MWTVLARVVLRLREHGTRRLFLHVKHHVVNVGCTAVACSPFLDVNLIHPRTRQAVRPRAAWLCQPVSWRLAIFSTGTEE